MHHTFHPTVYHNTLGPHEPVLRIRSGDEVSTTTVDAWGFDKDRRQVAQRPNPMTGPFYIEEAEPGDILRVTLQSIEPNRRYAFARTVTASNVVEPADAAQLPPSEIGEWDIDLDGRTAKFVSGGWNRAPLAISIDPMLGCFGVAPPRHQSLSTATSGEYGGNMDYRGFRTEAVVDFPVFEPGALFFLGDGHAVQGDGEITGNGLEVSMNVRFSVVVVKGKSARWPRGETREEIFTVGNARPLDQALQHATSEMLRWLQSEVFGLTATEAHLLLSQTVRYEIGNVFNPAYTVVCKIPQGFLPAGPRP